MHSIRQNLIRIAPHWTSLLSGALIVFAFPPWDLYPLIWFALVPWLWHLHRVEDRVRQIASSIWVGFFMTLGGMWWMAYAMNEFGKVSLPFAVLGTVFFAFICEPQFLGFALWHSFLGRSHPNTPKTLILTPLIAAAAFAAIDWILPHLWLDTLGHSLYLASWIRQAADLGGSPLLTFLIFWHNYALYFLIKNRKRNMQISYAVAAATCILLTLYGAWRENQIQNKINNPRTTVNFSVIQANIGDFEKVSARQGYTRARFHVIETYLEMSREAANRSLQNQVILWPETAYPATFRVPMSPLDIRSDERLAEFVRDFKVPLLFGGYDLKDQYDFNTLFFLYPEAKSWLREPGDKDYYHKHVLLPFGEYIPVLDQFDWVKEMFPQMGFFGRGIGARSMRFEVNSETSLQVSPIICYEALLPNYVMAGALHGSELILNVTNDSWFGKYGEPHLHLALTTFRTIETRLPQVRATNTGITALVLPTGEIAQRSEIGAKEIINLETPIIEPTWTLVRSLGVHWFAWVLIAVTILNLLSVRLHSRQQLSKS